MYDNTVGCAKQPKTRQKFIENDIISVQYIAIYDIALHQCESLLFFMCCIAKRYFFAISHIARCIGVRSSNRASVTGFTVLTFYCENTLGTDFWARQYIRIRVLLFFFSFLIFYTRAEELSSPSFSHCYRIKSYEIQPHAWSPQPHAL